MAKLEYDVCSRCGALFDDQGENGWWVREGFGGMSVMSAAQPGSSFGSWNSRRPRDLLGQA